MRLFTYLAFLIFSHSAFAQVSTPPVQWSYDGEGNNQHSWGSLARDYEICEFGTKQSPIKITYTKTVHAAPMRFNFQKSDGTLLHEGHMLKAEFSKQMTLHFSGKEYALEHLAFHSPSEHMIGEDFFPLEIHFMHRAQSGEKIMVAVFAVVGKEHTALASLLKQGPLRMSEHAPVSMNPADLLPATRGYYRYDGSLPYPPCTENVQWIIFKTPIEISKEQLAIIGKSTGRNARLTQPIYMRTIEETKN